SHLAYDHFSMLNGRLLLCIMPWIGDLMELRGRILAHLTPKHLIGSVGGSNTASRPGRMMTDAPCNRSLRKPRHNKPKHAGSDNLNWNMNKRAVSELKL